MKRLSLNDRGCVDTYIQAFRLAATLAYPLPAKKTDARSVVRWLEQDAGEHTEWPAFAAVLRDMAKVVGRAADRRKLAHANGRTKTGARRR